MIEVLKIQLNFQRHFFTFGFIVSVGNPARLQDAKANLRQMKLSGITDCALSQKQTCARWGSQNKLAPDGVSQIIFLMNKPNIGTHCSFSIKKENVISISRKRSYNKK